MGAIFPEVDFMQARAPKPASATCRGIIAGREALNADLTETAMPNWQYNTHYGVRGVVNCKNE